VKKEGYNMSIRKKNFTNFARYAHCEKGGI